MPTGNLALVREKMWFMRIRWKHLWPDRKRMAVYLAGPVDYVSWNFARSWRERAGKALAGAGWEVLNPLDCQDVYGGDTASAIVERQLAQVRKAAVVLAEAHWRGAPYIGTAMEIRTAWEYGIPVLLWGKAYKRSVWLEYHADARFDRLGDALGFLNGEAERYRRCRGEYRGRLDSAWNRHLMIGSWVPPEEPASDK